MMPEMVTIEPNPDFKPDAKKPSDKAQYEMVQQHGSKEVSYATAVEAVRNSNGMYRIKDEGGVVVTPSVWHAGKTNQELLAMMVGLGVKTEKQMKRSDIIALIEKKLGEIEVEDDTES